MKDQTDGYYFGGVDHGGALTAVWLKYYYARLIGSRYYQEVPTAVAENNDERIYAGVTDTNYNSLHGVPTQSAAAIADLTNR